MGVLEQSATRFLATGHADRQCVYRIGQWARSSRTPQRELDDRKWTQARAADYLFLTQPQVSKIRNGQFEDFSRDTLQEILRNLGIDVEVLLHKRADGGIGTLRVLQAG